MPLPSPLTFYRDSFSGLPRMVWLVALVAFVHRSGTMVLPFLALYLTSQKGLTAREAGGILSLYGVGSIGGSYLGGWLSDRIGSIQTQQASLCAAAIAFVSLSMMPTPFRIAVLVVLLSLVAESFRPANAATLAEMSPPELQVRAFSLRRMGTNLGMAIGPAVGGVLVVYSYTVLFFVEAGVCLLTAGLLWALFRDHIRDHRRDHPLSSSAQRHVDDADDADDAAHEIESPGSRSAWRDRIFLTLAGLTMLLITVLAQLFGTYPLTISEVYHLPEYTIGLVFTLNTLVIVIFQMVVIRMVERFDTLRVVGVGAFFLCAGFSLLQCTSSIVLIGVSWYGHWGRC